MLDMIKNDVVRMVMMVRIQSREKVSAAGAAMNQSEAENVYYQHADFNPNTAQEELLDSSAAAEHLQASLDAGFEVARKARYVFKPTS